MSFIQLKLERKPSIREAFSLCNNGNNVYIFGGFNNNNLDDLWEIKILSELNIKSRQLIGKTNNNPSSRHGSCLIYYKNKLILFGGYNQGTSKLLNDLWVYNILKNEWKNIETKSNTVTPPPMFYAGYCIYNNYLIIFGGKSKSYGYWTCLEDIYLLNLNNYSWKLINCKNKPSKRTEIGMCKFNDNIIIHGGFIGGKVLNDAYIIDIKSIINDNKPIWKKIDINIGGLSGHPMLSYKNKL